MANLKHKKILIVPLDWGLGHATRCIPLIHYLVSLKFEVLLAGSKKQKAVLHNEFPQLTYIALKGYNITYVKDKRIMPLKISLQIPKILLAIKRENIWLNGIINNHQIDLVISDNRYGLHSTKVPCIFITHQLLIKASFPVLERMIQKINYRYIKNFTECWVPDFEGRFNIAGRLSHPEKMPSTTVKYIGALSRFEPAKTDEKIYDWLIILSGPEPQRTLLERKIMKICSSLTGNIVIIRGLPDKDTIIDAPKNVRVYNHLPTVTMQQLLNQTDFVISRCGYTTIMEMLYLRKKCILIPTPGQTEQEYLAKHLMKQKWCYSCDQNSDLLESLNKAKNFQYNFPEFNVLEFKKIVSESLMNLLINQL